MAQLDDDDWDDDANSDEDEEPTVPCPYCQRDIHEESQRCPYCERYISEEDKPAPRKPWWIILAALVCLYAVYRWIMG